MNNLNMIKEIIFKEGYLSSEDFLQDWSVILALSKAEQYRAEMDFFAHKYGMDFASFAAQVHGEKGQEHFEKEDDLDDWEFAVRAAIWWEEKIRQIRHA